MNKINGYTKDEAELFVTFMRDGIQQGKKLSELFSQYSERSGRARGSVRNYYYGLLKNCQDQEVRKLIQSAGLKAERAMAFTDEETDKILREILRQKSHGISVRRAVLNLSGGDDKLMLRYQNKYRNVLSKDPARLKRLMEECGLTPKDEERAKIEEQINGLYDRLAGSLKRENSRLTEVVGKLTRENTLLKLQLKNLQ
jgi:hypothetical protein